jgi:Thioredoxin-like
VPHMKDLYAKYHDQGVEFIGVSLDWPEERGGLVSLKKFVKENQIPWPQYYQGKGWESEFSQGWGIQAIPAIFVVDSAGKLSSIEAREQLDELISGLLKKKPAGTE